MRMNAGSHEAGYHGTCPSEEGPGEDGRRRGDPPFSCLSSCRQPPIVAIFQVPAGSMAASNVKPEHKQAEAAVKARDWTLGMVAYDRVLAALTEVTSHHATRAADSASDGEERVVSPTELAAAKAAAKAVRAARKAAKAAKVLPVCGCARPSHLFLLLPFGDSKALLMFDIARCAG